MSGEPGPAAHPASAPAPFGRRLLRVTGNEQLGAYRVLRVADPDGPVPAPGQFAMLAAAECWGGGADERPHLPRAFSFARFNAAAREAHFLLEDVGPGTRRLCELRPEEHVWVLGPLGVGFNAPPPTHRAILVGGGVGIAPLAILQDVLGVEATVLLGFRDRARSAGAALLRDAQVVTDDGSNGHRGLVTDLLVAELERSGAATRQTPAEGLVTAKGSVMAEGLVTAKGSVMAEGLVTVYACGPAPMLEAVRALCAERSLPAQLALESGMACGYGACFGCVVPRRGGGYLRVCVDGPVVDARELDRVDAHAGAPA